MKKRLSVRVLVPLCTAAILLLCLVIWTIWGNTALMASSITISGNRIPDSFSGFRIA